MTQQLDCTYISPNKTIEEILITHNDYRKTIYVYNYKGNSFRVFTSQENLGKFFKYGSEGDEHFSTENELVKYLEQITP